MPEYLTVVSLRANGRDNPGHRPIKSTDYLDYSV